MIPAALFVHHHIVSCRLVVRCLSSISRAIAPTHSSTNSLFVNHVSERKPLQSPMKCVCGSSPTVCSNDVLRQRLYQHLSAGYQLPTVWYNAVMKKSIIDPLLDFKEYDLPTLPGGGERKEVPGVSTTVRSIKDPNQSEVADKMALHLTIIRRKKMKKHKRKKLKKRMRFVMRRRRQLKEKKKEREIQKYEREQAKLGELFSPEQYVDEQLALARKSGWHIDIIAEFNRERQKEKAAAASTSGSSSKQ